MPEDYSPSKRYPLILTLHGGSGETGNERHITQWRLAETWAEDSAQRQNPAFVFSPQYPQGRTGSASLEYAVSTYQPRIDEILASLIVEFPVDTSRLYITGLSAGSWATWYYIYWNNPARFAAAIPMSFGKDSEGAQITNIPVWAFHGDNDLTINVQGTRDMMLAIENAGKEVVYLHSQLGDIGLTELELDSLLRAGLNHIYTEYMGAGHVIWNESYDDPLLHRWLFSQTKTEGKEHDLKALRLRALENVPIFSHNIAPEVAVRNTGLSEEFNVSIDCEIDSAGILIYSDTKIIDSIKPFEFTTVSFEKWRTFDITTYDITFITRLPNDGDTSTDTLRSSITTSNDLDDFESGFGKWTSDAGWGTDGRFHHTGRFSMATNPGPTRIIRTAMLCTIMLLI